MDKIENRLSSLKALSSRKPLGSRPTYLYKNVLSKVYVEERRNSIGGK